MVPHRLQWPLVAVINKKWCAKLESTHKTGSSPTREGEPCGTTARFIVVAVILTTFLVGVFAGYLAHDATHQNTTQITTTVLFPTPHPTGITGTIRSQSHITR